VGASFRPAITVIAGSPRRGCTGRTNGIYSYNAGGNAGPLIWADPDNFRQTLSHSYNAMDALIPHFASGQAYPNDAYTVGGLLASINGNAGCRLGHDQHSDERQPAAGDGRYWQRHALLSQFVTDDNIEINATGIQSPGWQATRSSPSPSPYFARALAGPRMR